MMNLTQKAAYIKGLMEGMELDADKKEVKVINELLELVSDIAIDVEDLSEELEGVCEVIDELDEDLGMLEEEVMGELDDDFGDEIYEFNCPNCEAAIVLDEEMIFSDEVVCPACGEKIEVEIEDCDCDEDCDCKGNDEK